MQLTFSLPPQSSLLSHSPLQSQHCWVEVSEANGVESVLKHQDFISAIVRRHLWSGSDSSKSIMSIHTDVLKHMPCLLILLVLPAVGPLLQVSGKAILPTAHPVASAAYSQTPLPASVWHPCSTAYKREEGGKRKGKVLVRRTSFLLMSWLNSTRLKTVKKCDRDRGSVGKKLVGMCPNICIFILKPKNSNFSLLVLLWFLGGGGHTLCRGGKNRSIDLI